jgi:hypothetical protein
MRYPRVVLSVLFLSIPAHAASWETSTFRTPGGGLIRVGTSADDVRREMGPPLHQRAVRSSGQKRGGRGEENWTYRGNDGYYTLKLKAGKVTRINVQADRD